MSEHTPEKSDNPEKFVPDVVEDETGRTTEYQEAKRESEKDSREARETGDKQQDRA